MPRARCSTGRSRVGDDGHAGHGDRITDHRLDHPGPDPPEDPMPEAVIVSTARSPIGRANKGSMVDVRPDDLAATIVTAALDKLPQLDRQTVEDVMIGCAQPAGEQGYNLGRVVALLAGMDDVPGTTVNR